MPYGYFYVLFFDNFAVAKHIHIVCVFHCVHFHGDGGCPLFYRSSFCCLFSNVFFSLSRHVLFSLFHILRCESFLRSFFPSHRLLFGYCLHLGPSCVCVCVRALCFFFVCDLLSFVTAILFPTLLHSHTCIFLWPATITLCHP